MIKIYHYQINYYFSFQKLIFHNKTIIENENTLKQLKFDSQLNYHYISSGLNLILKNN